MSSSQKNALGRLPGEPKNRHKSSVSIQQVLSDSVGKAGTSSLTTLTIKEIKALMGKGTYPAYLDLSSSHFNLDDDRFLLSFTNIFKTMDLSANSLMELESLGHLSKLKYLFVDRNILSVISFRGLTGLEMLSLRQNRLETLTDMSDLKRLVNLDLANNILSSGFQELAKLRTLRVLDLSFNKIDMTLAEFHSCIMIHLKKMPKLEYLALEGNPVRANISNFRLYVIAELPKLKFLDWMPVTKDEHNRANRLDEQKAWDLKRLPVYPKNNATTSSSAAVNGENQPQQKRLSGTLDSLLSEIDQISAEMAQQQQPSQLTAAAAALSSTAEWGNGMESEFPAPPETTTAAAAAIGTSPVSDKEDKIDQYLDMLNDVTNVSTPLPPLPTDQQQQEVGYEGQDSIGPPAIPPPPLDQSISPAEPPLEDGSVLLDMLNDMLKEEQTKKQVPATTSSGLDLAPLVADSLDDLVSSIASLGTKSSFPLPPPPPPTIQGNAISSISNIVSTIATPTKAFKPTTPVSTPPASSMTTTTADSELLLESLPAPPQQQQPKQPLVLRPPGARTRTPPPAPQTPVVVTVKELDDVLGDLEETPSSSSACSSYAILPPLNPDDLVVPYGKITIMEKLGDGSIGETFLAGVLGTQGNFTVKKLRPQRFHTNFIEAFREESVALKMLPHHPNLFSVKHVTDEVVISYICDFVPGISLKSFLSTLKRREATDKRLLIACGVAKGLATLHAAGRTHGSLKLTDVVLEDKTLVPKLRDYGYYFIKRSNMIEGALFNPQFMAPELFANCEVFNWWSDVYSFGILLWFLFEGRWLKSEPAPQEGTPLDLNFEDTPNAIAEVVRLCCAADPISRPPMTAVVEALCRPAAELIRFTGPIVDAEAEARNQKLHVVTAKLNEMLTQDDNEAIQCKALVGVQSLIKSAEGNIAMAFKDGVHKKVLACLSSMYESVIEAALRTLIIMCERKEYRRLIGDEAPLDVILTLFSVTNESMVTMALRLAALLMKDESVREKFVASNVMLPLIAQLKSPNTVVVSNAALAFSKVLAVPSACQLFHAKSGHRVVMRLFDGKDPTIQIHLLSCMAHLMAYEPAQDALIEAGLRDKFIPLLTGRSELLQLHALKSIIKFTQYERVLSLITPSEWITPMLRFLKSSNVKLQRRTCQALANLACNDEECDRIESQGVLPILVTLLAEVQDSKLRLAVLNFLASLLRCPSCRNTFIDANGIQPLAKIFNDNNYNTAVQLACLNTFLSLAADETAVDSLADANIVTAVVRQLAAASARGDGERILASLRLVRALARGSDSAKVPVREAGGVEKLLEIIHTTPNGIDSAVCIEEAGMALAQLINDEDAVYAVMSSSYGFTDLFALISGRVNEEVSKALLQQFSILIRQGRSSSSLLKSGLIPAVISSLSNSPPMSIRSLSLKVILILASQKKNRQPLIDAGIIPALKGIASLGNDALRVAATKITTFLKDR